MLPPRLRSSLLLLGTVASVGCGGHSMPDPRTAADEYAQAVERGDSDAIYALLTSDAQRTHGKQGVKKLTSESKHELMRNAHAVSSGDSKVEMSATVRFADGEQAELPVQDGKFRVGSAGALPEGARTPAQALAELRQALARRSYSDRKSTRLNSSH